MPTIMIQGTTSDAGKSTLVAALCRCLVRRGFNVAPFKPQNMALNSAVTDSGGEIGRAQALQAQACNLKPTTDMNPILLKPATDVGAQVIIHGKARGNMSATSYHKYKQVAIDAVLESHQRLSAVHDIVVVEGAGSPAEINLRDNDIANMGFAEAVDCPVLIVADIDRGGVFAHLVGTLDLLSSTEQERVKGFFINRFRGDIALLESGLEWLEDRTKRAVLGVIPYLHGLHLDAEDALPHDREGFSESKFRIVVPVLPRISNHTDFDSLRLHPEVEFHYVRQGEPIPPADLIILPGSKSVMNDLNWLKSNGWEEAILKHVRYGGKLLGICGGFQMLGQQINDPEGVEGNAGSTQGLEFLNCITTMRADKVLRQRRGYLSWCQTPISGYEIHVGETEIMDQTKPFVMASDEFSVEFEQDGLISEDGLVAGTYWHGLFDSSDSTQAVLEWAGLQSSEAVDINALREQQLDRLADCFEQSVNIDELLHLCGIGGNA